MLCERDEYTSHRKTLKWPSLKLCRKIRRRICPSRSCGSESCTTTLFSTTLLSTTLFFRCFCNFRFDSRIYEDFKSDLSQSFRISLASIISLVFLLSKYN
uniref:Uncharacterized protein n=1 Tax=Cacopsylla melanoneura TaxID=428564 RepID=A0A8D9F8F7_9HEMI